MNLFKLAASKLGVFCVAYINITIYIRPNSVNGFFLSSVIFLISSPFIQAFTTCCYKNIILHNTPSNNPAIIF